MKKAIVTGLGIFISLLFALPSAFCAEVVGTVMDLQGRAVSDVKIVAQDGAGKICGQALTDAKGHYEISGLSPNTYDYTLNPLATGLKGGSAVSFLDTDGLTINWKVSKSGDAVALAAQGSNEALAGDPFGLSMPEFLEVLGVGTAVVTGGVLG